MSRSETTLYLSRAVQHAEHGDGFISGEELNTANTVRILQATFASETLQGNAGELARQGVSWRGARAYGGARGYFTLPGHHGAKCVGHDETLVRAALAEARLERAA